MTRLRAMSYNVRYDNPNDHHDVWHSRRDGVTNLVRFHRPDVVGFQEPVMEQRRDLRSRLPEYEFCGTGRRRNGEGEGCPIAVRTDRWEIDDNGMFWLSETPAEPSTGWDASHPRIATWARVSLRSDAERERGSEPDRNTGGGTAATRLLVVSTHLDHVGGRARRESARLIRERASDLAMAEGGATLPILLLGDFNCTPGSEPHGILTGVNDDLTGGPLRDAAALADLRHGPKTSITDFAELIDSRRIDHVLVSPGVDADAFATLADRDRRGRYPSDHLPVLARLVF